MTTPLTLTVDQIRARFPALARRHRGQPVAFFDGPGGTQVPGSVIEAMSDYLANHNANTHWEYPTSHETDAMIAESRQAMADLFGSRPDEVVFGANMTTLTFHLARGLARAWESGDEIVVTALDHHGNIGPWEAVARERGLVLQRIPFRLENGTLEVDRLLDALGERTRMVAVGWASNALGTVTDVAAICREAGARGITTFVDGVHGVPHVFPDVERIGCDFLACSPYKFYGPHLGTLVGRKERLDRVEVPKLRPAPDTAPERLETGTLSHEAIVGARAAVDFLASIAPREDRRRSLAAGYQVLHERGRALFQRLWDGLGAVPKVRRFGPGPDRPRTPTLGFVVDGVPSTAVARGLADRGVFVSHGDFYAATVVERLGLGTEGLVRVGAACYTNEAEVDRVIAGVGEIAAG